MNKKGATGPLLAVLVVSVLLLVGLISALTFGVIKFPGQSVVEKGETAKEVSEAVTTGDLVNLGIRVVDLAAADKQALVANIPVYCQKDGDGSGFLSGADGDRSSSTQAVNVKAERGTSVTCTAFNNSVGNGGSYYGEPVSTGTIKGESPTLQLQTKRAATSAKITVFNVEATNVNFTDAGVDAWKQVNTLQWESNQSNRNYNLAGFYIDVPENSNVSDMQIGGLSEADGIKIERVRTKTDFVFKLPSIKMVTDSDKLTWGPVKILTDGSGCMTVGSTDWLDFYAFDAGKWRSSKSETILQDVYEGNDQGDTDVGGPDLFAGNIGLDTRTIFCNDL